MEGQRTLAIGITVNLENYENLRLEVNGPVQNEDDADELISFLDSILQKFGQGDPASKESVEAFRRRILPAGPERAKKETVVTQARMPGGLEEQAPVVAQRVAPQQVDGGKTSPADAGDTDRVPTCEACGVPVKPAEQKMSMLFASRTLCRKCLKNV
ncbi:MAG: hypothetical protein QHH04_06010 [Methanolinea sp.]|nr:hypothetical protein [Methanolinea sp.]